MRQLIVLAYALLLCTAATAQEKVRFQTDWIASGEHAAYYGALVKGIWAQEGLDITITRGYGSGDTATKVGAGAADFGVSDVGAVLTARARASLPVKTIASVYSYSPHSLLSWCCRVRGRSGAAARRLLRRIGLESAARRVVNARIASE